MLNQDDYFDQFPEQRGIGGVSTSRAGYPWWSDPDTDPPAWMLDPRTPPVQATPGKYWNWNTDHWEMLDAPTAPVRPPTAPNNQTNTTVPPPTGSGGGGGGWDGMNFGAAPEGWNWPQFTAPRFAFDIGEPYTPGVFAAPSLQEAENEPGYGFARDQGRKMLETSAAGKGVLRSGGTLKDILEFGNKFAEQNYGNVFNRARDVFNTNEGNRFSAYQANFGNRLRGAESVFDRNYKSTWDEFSPRFDASKLEFGDRFNRWKTGIDALIGMSQPPV